jgi:uncharacterized SAM-binding protein YcdF (DUF218 family)
MPDLKRCRTAGLWLAGGFLALVGIFHAQTLTWIAKFLLLSQSAEPADLILVLGGNFYGVRALMGAELGASGYAKKVMISGPPYHNQPESELSIRFLVEKGYRRETFISFPNHSNSTISEAIAVCPELRKLGASRVLVVTSSYHSRRANVVYNLFCPGVQFRSIAAPDDQFEPDRWWKTPRYRDVFFSEWKKLLGTLLWKYPSYQLNRLVALAIGRL